MVFSAALEVAAVWRKRHPGHRPPVPATPLMRPPETQPRGGRSSPRAATEVAAIGAIASAIQLVGAVRSLGHDHDHDASAGVTTAFRSGRLNAALERSRRPSSLVPYLEGPASGPILRHWWCSYSEEAGNTAIASIETRRSRGSRMCAGADRAGGGSGMWRPYTSLRRPKSSTSA
jgi:hypothetical protein